MKVHLKDFKLEKSTYSWKNIGEGDIDWIEVRKAFGEIGYNGYVTTEVSGGDAAYLADLAVTRGSSSWRGRSRLPEPLRRLNSASVNCQLRVRLLRA